MLDSQLGNTLNAGEVPSALFYCWHSAINSRTWKETSTEPFGGAAWLRFPARQVMAPFLLDCPHTCRCLNVSSVLKAICCIVCREVQQNQLSDSHGISNSKAVHLPLDNSGRNNKLTEHLSVGVWDRLAMGIVWAITFKKQGWGRNYQRNKMFNLLLFSA